MEKIIDFIKAHPILSTSVAIGVLILFFWPSSSSSSGSNQSSISAQESAAIAAATQANAQVMVAQDQLQALGMQYSTAQAINGQNTAAQMYGANLAAQVASGQTSAALQAIQSNDSTQVTLGQLTLQSQNSAQDFISQLEHAGLDTPTTSVAGGNFGGTSTQGNNLAAQTAQQSNTLQAQIQQQLTAAQQWAVSAQTGAFLASPSQPAPGYFPLAPAFGGH